MEPTSLIAPTIILFTAIVSLWNSYHTLAIGKIVAELQLNLRKEMNGRYIVLDRFNDLKERVGHLEDNDHNKR